MGAARPRSPLALHRAAWLATALAAAAGCATMDVGGGAGVERPPELLSAGSLELPADCTPEPGAVYRAEYVVEADGAVGRVTRTEGPACVRSALSGWVQSFRYAPGTSPENATVDWMVTVARQ